MVKQIIREIVNNFHEQLSLYQEMATLSSDQLGCLEENKSMSGELQLILAERQKLMEKIGSLNEQNRSCQQQALQQLGIDEFVLSKLTNRIDEADYNDLKNRVVELGKVLELINEMDRKNQLLMVEVNTSGRKYQPKTSSKQVDAAYRKAMQGKKYP